MRIGIRDLQVEVLDSRPDAAPTDPAFVLVHGLGVSSLYFRALVPHLTPHARVVSLDLPGFGRADAPERSLHIQNFALVLIDALDRLGLTDVVLIGHSMGVQVVVEALALRPGLAKGAVLIGPVVRPGERTMTRVVGRFFQSAAHETLASAWPSVVAWLRCGPGWFFATFPAMLSYRLEDRIADVTAHVALVAGEFDRLAPRDWLEALRDNAGDPEATVEIVGGAAHQVMATHPDVVRDICLRVAGLT